MTFDRSEFISGFTNETNEHLQIINTQVVNLKNDSKNKNIIKEILRRLHTIKGSARMLSFSYIEKISHSLEDVFKGMQEEHYEITDVLVKLTFEISDLIKSMLEKIQKEDSDEANIEPYIDFCKKAVEGTFFTADEIENAILEHEVYSTEKMSTDDETENFDDIKSIRIDISRINDISKSVDNLIIRQFRLKHQIDQFEKKLSDAHTEIEFPRQLKEDLLLTENSIFEIQKQILNLRMLPLDLVLSPLTKEIKEEAIKLNKNISVDIPQTGLMMDKMILEQLRPILIHLVRNSLDHGIEETEVRKENGKSEQGKISIHTEQISNHIIITFKDDGRGIQYDKVKERAKTMFPAKKNEIETMKEKDLQQYLFMAGFSTVQSTTSMSGRGMGLDIVRSNMEKIKGRIRITTRQGLGTTFELTIPLSLATQRGIFVAVGKSRLMIPSQYVQQIIASENEKIFILQNQNFININNTVIPLYYMSTLLGTEKTKNISSIIIVEYLEATMAIVVDSITQNENVIVNPLPSIISKMEALQGVVYDENYEIIPILNIPYIMKQFKELLEYDIKKYQTLTKKKIHKILIVDDSFTTRQIEQTIFESSGYDVTTAFDGVDAMEKIKMFKFDLIVTDISMPRMDGKSLISNIRRLEDYGTTPVIVVSGVYDKKEKDEFIKLGAQAFIVKNDFKRGNLLDCAKELLNGK